ncbi:hypothetical protein BDW22DRAFT_1433745 [Trametopsis cervina]|nr:hypothetical protein BDW22DRAFT_1433745 [Trametopsis cervina]
MKFVNDMQESYGLTVSTEVRLQGEGNESCVLKFDHTAGLSMVTETAIALKNNSKNGTTSVDNDDATHTKVIATDEPAKGDTVQQATLGQTQTASLSLKRKPTVAPEHQSSATPSAKRKRTVTPERTPSPGPSVKRKQTVTPDHPSSPAPSVKRKKSIASTDRTAGKGKKKDKTAKGKEVARK